MEMEGMKEVEGELGRQDRGLDQVTKNGHGDRVSRMRGMMR